MVNTGIVWQVVIRPVPLALLLFALVASTIFGRRLSRDAGAAPATGGLSLATIGVVVTLTCTADTRHVEDFGPAPVGLSFLAQLTDSGEIAGLFVMLPMTDEQLANVALYLPVGVLAQALWRNPLKSLGFAVLLSLAVETWQSYVGRSADLRDVRNNVLGAVAGVLLVIIAGPRVRARVRRRIEAFRIERILVVCACAVAALLTAVMTAVLLGQVV